MSSTGLFVTFVVLTLLAPMVSAITTPTPGDGDTAIESDGSPEIWLADCPTESPPYDCDTTHDDDTDVYVTMTADWVDNLRGYPAANREHRYHMKAMYSGTDYHYWYNVTTDGDDSGNHLLYRTVPNVGVNTYMSVYYNASIYNPYTGQPLGYLEGTSLFYFVP
jgi:hypothetical protein